MQQIKQEVPPEFRVFLEDLVDEAGIIMPDFFLREEMLIQLSERLDKFLFLKVAQNLSKENMQTFLDMTEKEKSREEIYEFMNSKIPELERVMKDAFVEFRLLYLDKNS